MASSSDARIVVRAAAPGDTARLTELNHACNGVEGWHEGDDTAPRADNVAARALTVYCGYDEAKHVVFRKQR